MVRRLRDGDEDAFARVVESWSPLMARLARHHVSTPDSAEEVVQDTWLAVLDGLDRFEGRSTLRTWVFRILVNKAKTCGVRESRTVPWTAAFPGGLTGPLADVGRAAGRPGAELSGFRCRVPAAGPATPEGEALSGEVRRVIRAALDRLPPRQRAVLELRDVHGSSSAETCAILGISTGNQRVLLHRARSAVRCGLRDYLADVP